MIRVEEREGSTHITFPVVGLGYDTRVTLQLYEDDGVMVCGLRFLEGRIRLKRHAMLAAVHRELSRIEDIARQAGCTEMRHAGEARLHLLPGYEPMPDKPNLRNGRRKRL